MSFCMVFGLRKYSAAAQTYLGRPVNIEKIGEDLSTVWLKTRVYDGAQLCDVDGSCKPAIFSGSSIFEGHIMTVTICDEHGFILFDI
jgi:hypothetical protein